MTGSEDKTRQLGTAPVGPLFLRMALSDGIAFVVTACCYLAVMRRIKGRGTE